ncbi:hypothetical protein CHS0354_012635 [Potamilus streckersoni]|uniref:Methyltransferase domain-containing protein n=1 Tax=Potamilus streckersoni TaxID=2493646 RepID=A0AAE0SXQ5_9BIVA|nr:hypothetical protein CHS0354_012635 [Potamilus streckersoni]
MQVYIEGFQANDQICLPLSSVAVIFVHRYCSADLFHLNFVGIKDRNSQQNVTLSSAAFDQISHSFLQDVEVPQLVQNCALPIVQDTRDNIVRSGLCCTLRYIIKLQHECCPGKSLVDLLGFRGGSLKACAEMSGWTKLCEVDLPHSISQLIQDIKSSCNRNSRTNFEIAADVMKLEWYFEKPPLLHNNDKRKRELIKQIQTESVAMKTHADDVDAVIKNFFQDREIVEPHDSVVYRVVRMGDRSSRRRKEEKAEHLQKNKNTIDDVERKKTRISIQTGDLSQLSTTDHMASEITDVDSLISFVKNMTLHNIEFVHLYSEGIQITVADLILFVYMYYLMKSIQFNATSVLEIVPNIIHWLEYLVKLPLLWQTCEALGFDVLGLQAGLKRGNTLQTGIGFTSPRNIQDLKENIDIMEISQKCKSKYHPSKPEIDSALQIIKKTGIEPQVSDHPCGSNVQLDWEGMPPVAHPRDELPEKRVARKCQQLENLVTAVKAIARDGNVIVDFCSGGGHLGIVLAYLLPRCQIYLVENKEESLIRAKNRVERLKLSNVILYQCNMDYFCGKFDVGVCLHACGVATDMVLKKCLENQASFVICPCCYGGIQNTHLIAYPRSQCFRDSIEYKDYLTLGHAADQTEVGIESEAQGKYCMNLVDTDRAMLAQEHGYEVILCSLHPLSCTPKNNLLIGTYNILS